MSGVIKRAEKLYGIRLWAVFTGKMARLADTPRILVLQYEGTNWQTMMHFFSERGVKNSRLWPVHEDVLYSVVKPFRIVYDEAVHLAKPMNISYIHEGGETGKATQKEASEEAPA